METCDISFNVKHKYTLTKCKDIVNDIKPVIHNINSVHNHDVPKIMLSCKPDSDHDFDYVAFELPLNFEGCSKSVLDVYDGADIGLSVMFDIDNTGRIKFFDCDILKNIIPHKQYGLSKKSVAFEVLWTKK